MGIDLLKVSEVMNMVGNGVTEPHYGIINGVHCVIKSINNPEGHLALFNEFVGYSIAELFQLSLPNFGFAVITNETKFDEEITKQVFTENSLCFYTEQIEKALPLRSSKQISDATEMELLKILYLDYLICNKDRNPGNILVRKTKIRSLQIFPIDYTHAFELQVLWDGLQLKRFVDNPLEEVDSVSVSEQLIHQIIRESKNFNLSIIEECRDYLFDKLKDFDIRLVVKEIPETLLSLIDDEDYYLFIEFVNIRLNSLNEITDKLLQNLSLGGGKI